jgi:hypothetical protein
VLVAMDQGVGSKTVPLFGVFPEETRLVDEYSGVGGVVSNGTVSLNTESGLVLLSERR